MLDLRTAYAASDGQSFAILASAGASASDGTFNGLPEGALVLVDDQSFAVTYVGGSGANDVVLTRFHPTITEGTPDGTVVARVAVGGIAPRAVEPFRLLDDAGGAFLIDPGTGEVQVGEPSCLGLGWLVMFEMDSRCHPARDVRDLRRD